jgi:RNA-directed DNA polymerase
MQKTAKDRLNRTLCRFSEWCRWHRHDPLDTQHRMLVKKLKGHYGYYGITGNSLALAKVLDRSGGFGERRSRAGRTKCCRGRR